MDLRMSPYRQVVCRAYRLALVTQRDGEARCVSTGEQQGIIEVVQDACTVGSILLQSMAPSKTKLAIHKKCSAAMVFSPGGAHGFRVSRSLRLTRRRCTTQPCCATGWSRSVGCMTCPPRSEAHSGLKAWSECAVSGTGLQLTTCTVCLLTGSLHTHKLWRPLCTHAQGIAWQRGDICVLARHACSVLTQRPRRFIMGVGDRHNDNVMLTSSGQLLHIDFGHIMGNFKTKFGMKRERAPFLLTPAFVGVMGGPGTQAHRVLAQRSLPSQAEPPWWWAGSPQFSLFSKLCCDAFLALRRRSNLLLSLFSLMLGGGLPELQTEDDLSWMRASLMVRAANDGCDPLCHT